jgi:hypothetical protein
MKVFGLCCVLSSSLIVGSVNLWRSVTMLIGSIPSAFRIAGFLTLAVSVISSIRCIAQTTAPSSLGIGSTHALFSAVEPNPASQAVRASIQENYGKLPISFEANRGQADDRVKFLARGKGYGLYLTGQEAVLVLHAQPQGSPAEEARRSVAPHDRAHSPDSDKADVIRMQLRGANSASQPDGVDELPGTVNYFIGIDPSKWRTRVPVYSRVRFSGVYPGVDLVYYGNQRELEYDFVVAPQADPKAIQLHFAGASKVEVTSSGDLSVVGKSGHIAFHKPEVYQEIDGKRQVVRGGFTISANRTVGFSLADYDRSRPVTIDPVLVYSTYLGGALGDTAFAVAADSTGNAYVAGITVSYNFPVTSKAFQRKNLAGNSEIYYNAFVSKLNPSGTALVYSSYLGGAGGAYANGISVDALGDAFITGVTGHGFPITAGAFQPANFSESTGFVTKLDSTGSELIYSTYLGGSGSESANAIAVNAFGNAYVSGLTSSTDFPVTSAAFQRANNNVSGTAFVSEFNAAGAGLIYSTYLGGSGNTGNDSAQAIALDSSGDAFVAGSTGSQDFPVTPGAYLTSNDGGFIAKLNPAGTGLLYSTYFNAAVSGIAVDKSGDAYVTGSTGGNFPVTLGAIQSPSPTGFISKLNPAGAALVYSATLGSGVADSIAVDDAGDAVVAGYAGSGLGLGAGVGSFCAGGAFVSKLNPTGTELLYSTSLAGSGFGIGGDGASAIALDGHGNAYVTGCASSFDFPVTLGAFQTINKYANINTSAEEQAPFTPTGFVAKLALDSPGPSTSSSISLTAITAPSVAAGSSGPPYDSLNSVFPIYLEIFGQSSTYMATVAGVGTSQVPTGNVVFVFDGFLAATVPLTPAGTATFTTSNLKFGQNLLQAFYTGDSSFSVSDASIYADGIPDVPSISPDGGLFTGSVTVNLSTASPDTTIYYTLDGSLPGIRSPIFKAPIILTAPGTMVRAIAAPDGQGPTAVTQTYALFYVMKQTPAPIISPGPGSYTIGQTIAISDADATATIRYTTDGSVPATHSNWYHQPVALTGSETIQAIAISTGAAESTVSSVTYVVP